MLCPFSFCHNYAIIIIISISLIKVSPGKSNCMTTPGIGPITAT